MVTNADDEVGTAGAAGRARYRWAVLFTTILVVLIASGCPNASPPIPPGELFHRDVSKGIHDTSPVRGATQALALHQDGDSFPCSSCHDGFVGDQQKQSLEDQHKNLVFDHGANSSCLNCHNSKNSDTYVDYSGNEIPGDQPTKLCAKCHGPQTREWEHGIHGRTNGHWNASFGEQVKLDCVQCHDPHKPHFAQMVPRRQPRFTRFQPIPDEPKPLPVAVPPAAEGTPPAADAAQPDAAATEPAPESAQPTAEAASPAPEGGQPHAN